MSYLEHIRNANLFDISGFIPFIIDNHVYGCVRHSFAERLSQWPEVFQIREQQLHLSTELAPAGVPVAERNLAVAEVCNALRQEGLIHGWRDELYPLCKHWNIQSPYSPSLSPQW